MPPENKPGHLYFSVDGGETYKPFAKVTEVPDLSGTCIHGEDGFEQCVDLRHAEITFTATVTTKRSVIWFLTGDKRMLPNNWLKMHGIAMERRRHG